MKTYTKDEKKKYYEEQLKPFKDKINGYYEDFVKHFQEILDGKDTIYNKYVDFLLQFPQLSANNIALAYFEAQCRQANIEFMFKRYHSWKRYERQVKTGEHSYNLLEPVFQKYPEKVIFYNADTNSYYKMRNPQEDEVTTVEWTEGERIGFRGYATFDVTQTEGKELPIDNPFHRLGTNTRPELIQKLEIVIERLGFKLEYGKYGQINGWTDGKTVAINEKLSKDDRALTGFHETIHAIAHYKRVKNEKGETEVKQCELNKQQKELDAELGSFLVGRCLGIESKGYRYVAMYKATGELLRESMDRIYPSMKKLVQLINQTTIQKKTTQAKTTEPTPEPIIKAVITTTKPQRATQTKEPEPRQQIELPIAQTTLFSF